MKIKFIDKAKDKIDEYLKKYCSKLPPNKRMVIVIATCSVFAIASLYMIASAIYNISTNKSGKMQKIEHIKQLELQKSNDSINLLKQNTYELPEKEYNRE